MPTTYSQPDMFDTIRATLERVMAKWHQHLSDAEVRVGILYATSDDEDAPPLKRNGAPLIARIRVLSLMWRVLTNVDALLEIDQRAWNDLDDDSQVASIDHELSHLNTVRDGNDNPKRDDIGRPKLTTCDPSWWSSDGFLDVVKRHGEAAIEAINARRAHGLVTAAIQEALNETPEEEEAT